MHLRQLFDVSLVARRDQVGLEWQGRNTPSAKSTRAATGWRRTRQPWPRARRPSMCLSRQSHRADRSVSGLREARRDFRADQHSVSRARDFAHRQRRRAEDGGDASGASGLLAEAGAVAQSNSRALDGDTPAALVYTSGTTGNQQGRDSHAQQFRRQRRESGQPAGRSRSATAFCWRCRCFMSTRSATACIAG